MEAQNITLPAFVANSEKDILNKAKELKEKRKQEYKNKLNNRIEEKAKNPLNNEETELLEKAKKGETIVIDIEKHYAVRKWANDNNRLQLINRYSPDWGNPFILGIDGDRNHVCDAYTRYYNDKKSLHSKIHTLKGKVLGCHCYPLRCHGNELIKILNGK